MFAGPQHYFLTNPLYGCGQIHFFLGDKAFRQTRWTAKQFMELVRGHGETLAIIEVRHVEGDGTVLFDRDNFIPNQIGILGSAIRSQTHQFVLTGVDAKTANNVEIRFAGKGGFAYQVVGSYFLPWDEKSANEPLSIDVAYDRTHLTQDDVAAATATIKNNLAKNANMVMVDLGIAPGFDLLSEDLQSYVEKGKGLKSGRLEKFSLTATQAILYFDSFAPGETVTLHFRLRAKYPIRARTFQSRVYEYYDPQVNAVAHPVQLDAHKL